ncbi:MAG: hypothetical protein V5A88_09850 [Candidatus Thermoplasmatota archaeon]
MGKSVPTFREELEKIESDWRNYRDILRGKEKKMFDELFEKARKHTSAAQSQANPDPVESILFSILLEQQMEIDRLKRKMEDKTRKEDERVLVDG